MQFVILLTYVCLFLQSRPSTDIAFESDLEMRVARSRQTVDFAARQHSRFSTLSHAKLNITEALSLLDTLPRHAPVVYSALLCCGQ